MKVKKYYNSLKKEEMGKRKIDYESLTSRNILCLTLLSSTHTSNTYAKYNKVSFVSLFTTTYSRKQPT